MVTESIEKLAKACAFIIFADEKIDQSEIDTAKAIFDKYHLDSRDGEKLIKQYLDEFIDASEEPKEEESVFELGDLEIYDIDSFEVLKDLSLIMVSDNEISLQEVENIHFLCKAFGLDPIFSSLAILNAVKTKGSLKINLE